MLEQLLGKLLGDDFSEIQSKVKQALSEYSPEEMEEVIARGGVEELFYETAEKAMGSSFVGKMRSFLEEEIEEPEEPMIEGLKEKLRSDNYYKRLSEEVEEYFIDTKAKSVVKHEFSFKHSKDDRMGENLDIMLANFRFNSSIDLPFSEDPERDILLAEIQKPENSAVGEFTMRQTPEHLKLLVYYAKVSSVADLRFIFKTFEERNSEIADSIAHRDYYGHMKDHPVEFMDAMGGPKIEYLLKKTNVSSVHDFNKLFFDAAYMGPFMAAVDFKIMDYIIDFGKIDSVDGLIGLTKNENFRKKLLNIKSEGDYSSNLVYSMEYFNVADLSEMKNFIQQKYASEVMRKTTSDQFKQLMDITRVENLSELETLSESISDVKFKGNYISNLSASIDYFNLNYVDEICDLAEFERIRSIMQTSSSSNFSTLLEISGVESENDLERLCSNVIVSQNIGDVDYTNLGNSFRLIGVENEKANKYMFEIISHSYTKAISDKAREFNYLTEVMDLPESLKEFILPTLLDEDYVEQNLDSVTQLIRDEVLMTDEAVNALTELKDLMGGFITPELSKRYVLAEAGEGRQEVLETYQKMMSQVLGSGKIEIEDPDLLTEIICLAYRPTGYSIPRINQMIGGWGGIEDLTHQLDNINFERDGYDLQFSKVERVQTEKYDSTLLHAIDGPMFSRPKKEEMKGIIKSALSAKPKDRANLPKLFSEVLEEINDDRVIEYTSTYYSHKGADQTYNEQRLESLTEVLGIIPKEDVFYETLTSILSNSELVGVAKESANKYQWQQQKRNFSAEERTCKNRIDEAIKHLSQDSSSNVTAIIKSEELQSLGTETIDQLVDLPEIELLEKLQEIRNTKFLGYGSEDTKSYVDVFYQTLLAEASSNNRSVKKEMRKVVSMKSEDIANIKGIISKNVGSYFAKAGAEICTSHNTSMWSEERHSHLNLVYNNQIIGNLMLYFEPERDYLVVRGFNPRKDTMMNFDRYSMASEIVGVLENIAAANGYKEIFVPEQTGWHALSNRDGMAKEIIGISKKNSKLALEQNPDQRTVIDDANFYVTEMHGTSMNRLNLLSVVGK